LDSIWNPKILKIAIAPNGGFEKARIFSLEPWFHAGIQRKCHTLRSWTAFSLADNLNLLSKVESHEIRELKA
jgi:hypothetical protein